MNYFPLSLYCLRGAQCNRRKPVMKCNEMRRRVIGLKSAPVISKIHLRSHNMKEEDGGGEYLATDTISNATVPKLSGKHICAWKRYFRLSGTHCPKDSKHTKHILCLCGAGIKGYLTCNIFLDSFLPLIGRSILDFGCLSFITFRPILPKRKEASKGNCGGF